MSDIVLIHGLWMTPLSWQGWKERFEARGHNVLAPGWPGVDDRDVEAIREDPSALEGLGLEEVADHYEAIVRGLDAPPDHHGPLLRRMVTQILLDRGLGAAGVASLVALQGHARAAVLDRAGGDVRGPEEPVRKGQDGHADAASSSTTRSPTRSMPPRRRRSTSACRSPARRGRSSRLRSRTSTPTRRSR